MTAFEKKFKLMTDMKDDEASLRYIIHGVNIEKKDDKGMTFLHRAVLGNYHLIVRILLECGADPQIQDNVGRNALHIAVLLAVKSNANNDMQIIELLLMLGADHKISFSKLGMNVVEIAHNRRRPDLAAFIEKTAMA